MDQEPEEGGGIRGGIERLLPDGLKKAVLAGAGALFMSEEGIRSALADLKLPKEVAQFLLSQVAKTKDDLFKALSKELRDFLESTKLAEELKKLLTTISLQISTTVRFIPEGDQLQPKTKTKVRVMRERRKKRMASKRSVAAKPQ